jgi:hypothetical protein
MPGHVPVYLGTGVHCASLCQKLFLLEVNKEYGAGGQNLALTCDFFAEKGLRSVGDVRKAKS